MPGEEIDFLFGGDVSQPGIGSPLDSQDPASQDAPPTSSLSPGDTDPQFTPSSTAYDLTQDDGDLGGIPNDFGTEYTNSPIEGFERISPHSSRSSDYSYINQSFSNSLNGTSPSFHASRESTGGPIPEVTQQQWTSFDTIASDTGSYVEAPHYHGFHGAAAVSTGAFSDNNLYGMTLPLRAVQQNQAWAPTGVQSSTYIGPSWGNIHEQPMFLQNEPLAPFAQQHIHTMQCHDQHQAQMSHVTGSHTIPKSSGEPLTPGHQQLIPFHAEHSVSQQYDGGSQIPDRTRNPTPTVRAALAHSTRRRYPDHPAIAAEQKSPTSPKQKQRQLAVANPEDIPVTARPRDPQEKPKHGGRKRNSHLNQDARDRSSRMRKKGACWRCKLQRDPVSLSKECNLINRD